MDFKEFVAALRVRWWLVLAGLVVGGLAAAGISLMTVPRYTSHSQLFVSTTDSTSAADAFQGGQFSQQRVASYARLLTTDRLLSRVIDELQLNRTPAQLADDVTAAAVPDTVLLTVTATDTSPARARAIAGAMGDQFARMVADLETPAGSSASPVKVTVVDLPELPLRPSEPQWVRNIAVGLLAGLVVGAGVAVGRAKLDRTVREPEEAMTLAAAPVIGTIMRDERLAKDHVLNWVANGPAVEDYRQLCTNLQFLDVDEPPKTIMLSSALPSEGKTTAAINLGLALADTGQRVTVVEADLRRPQVTAYLGLVGGAGLTNVLAGTATIDEVVQPYLETGMMVIGAGPTPPNPGKLLASSHMAALIDKLRGANDFVIIDAPPLLPVADATGLATLVDGVLLSVRYGTTRKDRLRHAAVSLGLVRAKLLGLILNIVPPTTELASAYAYGYDYRGRHSS